MIRNVGRGFFFLYIFEGKIGTHIPWRGISPNKKWRQTRLQIYLYASFNMYVVNPCFFFLRRGWWGFVCLFFGKGIPSSHFIEMKYVETHSFKSKKNVQFYGCPFFSWSHVLLFDHLAFCNFLFLLVFFLILFVYTSLQFVGHLIFSTFLPFSPYIFLLYTICLHKILPSMKNN